MMDMLSSASCPFKLVKITTLQMFCQGRIWFHLSILLIILVPIRLFMMDMLSSASCPFKLVKITILQMFCQGRIRRRIGTTHAGYFPFYSLPCLTAASALFLMPMSIFGDVVRAIGPRRKRLLPSAFLRPR